MHKAVINRCLLATLVLNTAFTPQQARADDAADVALVALGAAALAALGYGAYKWHESASFGWAQDRLERNINEVHVRMSQYQGPRPTEEAMIQTYEKDASSFRSLLSTVRDDINTLRSIKNDTEQDARTWRTTDKARGFVRKAQQFARELTNSIEIPTEYERYLLTCGKLLDLTRLHNTEAQQIYARILYAYMNGKLSDATVRSCYSNSAWPLLQAHEEMSTRVRMYQSAVQSLGNHTSPITRTLRDASNEKVHYLVGAQQVITGSPEYTQDLRAKKLHDQQQAQLRAAQEQAEAARRQAEAAQRQAAAAQRQAEAQEAHNRQHLRDQLIRLQGQLTEVDIRLGNVQTYRERDELQSQRRRLVSEIYDLKRRLNDDNWFAQIFINFVL